MQRRKPLFTNKYPGYQPRGEGGGRQEPREQHNLARAGVVSLVVFPLVGWKADRWLLAEGLVTLCGDGRKPCPSPQPPRDAAASGVCSFPGAVSAWRCTSGRVQGLGCWGRAPKGGSAVGCSEGWGAEAARPPEPPLVKHFLVAAAPVGFSDGCCAETLGLSGVKLGAGDFGIGSVGNSQLPAPSKSCFQVLR